MNKAIHPQYITDEHGKRVSVVLAHKLPAQVVDTLLDAIENCRSGGNRASTADL
ncbi:hypothetical protein [Spirosoma sp.]|uniref:hypothetical protein n=1 Tax=Spirosoma sp. TaxID=1899569 RepID=UPI00262ABBD9|nr:hypothetical protein [Spirosoma sp.]MCX6217938.1 hypothetical protein [Spirosoma sp.]